MGRGGAMCGSRGAAAGRVVIGVEGATADSKIGATASAKLFSNLERDVSRWTLSVCKGNLTACVA